MFFIAHLICPLLNFGYLKNFNTLTTYEGAPKLLLRSIKTSFEYCVNHDASNCFQLGPCQL